MTACAAHRASNEKRAVPSHDVCQVQDSCGSQGARVVKSGTGSLLRETLSQQTRAQSHSHFRLSLSCQVFVLWDMLFFCLSQVCLICHMLSSVSPHFRLDSSPCRPVFASSPLHGDYLSTDTLGVPFGSLLRKTHEFVGLFSSTHNESTSAPRRRRSAEQPHGSFVTVKTQASSRPSGHRVRVIFRVPPLL